MTTATDVSRKLVAAIALACLLSTTGCFTIVGGVIGSVSDGPPKAKRPPHAPEEDTGMSGGAKGMLAGFLIDAALVTAAAIAFKNMDFGFGGSWGCSDSGCSD